MKRPSLWLLASPLLPLALGCVGTDLRSARKALELSPPRKLIPSPEAAHFLRENRHEDEAGGFLSNDHYACQRLERLENELRKVGAHMGPDGTVYDQGGWEVYVYEHIAGPGCWQLEEQIRERIHWQEEELRHLRKHYTVIELPYYGPLPC